MSPDKVIRKAVVDALFAKTGVLVTEQVVPMSIDTPDIYVLVNSQSKNRTANSKEKHEWLCSITLTLVKINEKGYISSAELDDLESDTIEVMDNIAIPGYRVGFSRFFDSISDSLESPADTIVRKNVIYELWLNKKI